MFWRSTASAIASASRKSFLFDFTNGLTNWARDQLHIMALCSQNAAEEVRPRTGLHPNQRGLHVGGEGDQLLLGELLLQQHLAVIAERHQVKGRLAKINPYGTN